MDIEQDTSGTAVRRARERGRLLAVTGCAGVIAPVLFTASFLLQEAFRRDEFSPVAEPVSALEAGPNGWVQQVTFVAFGVLTMVHAVGLHQGIERVRGGVAGPALLFLTGVGSIISGLVPLREDAAGVTYDPGGHIVGGMLFFLGTPAAFLALGFRLRRDRRWRGLASWTTIAGIVLVGMAVVMNVLVIPDSAPLHDRAGLVQRLSVLVLIFPCRIALGLRLLAVARPSVALTAPPAAVRR